MDDKKNSKKEENIAAHTGRKEKPEAEDNFHTEIFSHLDDFFSTEEKDLQNNNDEPEKSEVEPDLEDLFDEVKEEAHFDLIPREPDQASEEIEKTEDKIEAVDQTKEEISEIECGVENAFSQILKDSQLDPKRQEIIQTPIDKGEIIVKIEEADQVGTEEAKSEIERGVEDVFKRLKRKPNSIRSDRKSPRFR